MKHRSSSKKWIFMFIGTVVFLFALLIAFNFITDPFGATGDYFFQWWSYDETLDPGVAKISYLDQHYEEYDSYILGSSSASSYPVDVLNEYMDARSYNLFTYGADMYDIEKMAQYVLENYEVKNLVVDLCILNAGTYGTGSGPVTYDLHYKVDGTSALTFFRKYLLADPRYGLEKIRCYLTDSYVQAAYDMFNVTTGAYDKSRQDVEGIGDLASYLSRDEYAIFTDHPTDSSSIPYLEECMNSMQAIVDMCKEHDVSLLVVTPPLYYDYTLFYAQEDFQAFTSSLAEITDYWDFTMSSVSYEPRYFYGSAQFRNCVGAMALARIFGDDSVYVPDGFGYLVTEDTVDGLMDAYEEAAPLEEEEYTAQVPILMYHELAETGDGGYTMSVDVFAEQMEALYEAGYTTVTFEDLRDYVETGAELPEKPIVITFDDGYEGALTLAYPILKRYGMQATIFVIGVSIGKDTYKDTGVAMIPHFSLEEALGYADVFDIQSHGYDIHEVEGRDEDPIRHGILQRDDETEEEYIAFLRQDAATMFDLFYSTLGYGPGVLAYPNGLCSTLSAIVLSECGIWATVTMEQHTNTIIKGMPQSLLEMGRYTMTDSVSGADLLTLLTEG